jgi:copper chaperone CopZ
MGNKYAVTETGLTIESNVNNIKKCIGKKSLYAEKIY